MVCLSQSLTVGVLASLVALEAAAVPVNQQATFDGSAFHQTLRGMPVRYISNQASSDRFSKRSHDYDHDHDHGLDHDHDHDKRASHPNQHEDEQVHKHVHINEKGHHHRHRHHHHGSERIHKYVHIHDRDHQHRHDEDHEHVHNHGHHDKRGGKYYVVKSHDKHPIISILLNVGSVQDRRRQVPGFLDPVADLLQPFVGSLLGAIEPALEGLPIIGGVINILGQTIGSIGGSKIGALLTGKPLSNAAYVTGGSSLQSFAYQIDASDSKPASMFIAKLPYTNNLTCPNATTIPVMVAIPIINNDSFSVMCATYDSTPFTPSALTAQPCRNMTAPTIANSSMSQVLAYDQLTGILHPLWNATEAQNFPGCTKTTSFSTISAGNSTNGGSEPVNMIFVPSKDGQFDFVPSGTPANSTQHTGGDDDQTGDVTDDEYDS